MTIWGSPNRRQEETIGQILPFAIQFASVAKRIKMMQEGIPPEEGVTRTEEIIEKALLTTKYWLCITQDPFNHYKYKRKEEFKPIYPLDGIYYEIGKGIFIRANLEDGISQRLALELLESTRQGLEDLLRKPISEIPTETSSAIRDRHYRACKYAHMAMDTLRIGQDAALLLPSQLPDKPIQYKERVPLL